MITNMNYLTIGLLLVLSVIMYQMISLVINYFWKKFTKSDDFVTQTKLDEFCSRCSTHEWVQCIKDIKKDMQKKADKEDIAIIRGVLLVVAVKVGVEADEIKELTK